jgi:uncharacterized protein (TIGR02147 family)
MISSPNLSKLNVTSHSQRIIKEELLRRQARNKAYSIRALARDLSIPKTTLSDVIQGKRRLAPKSIDQLRRRLMLSENEIKRLIEESRSDWFETKAELSRRTLNDEEFGMICNWHFYAILSLSKLPDNKADSQWVAKYLGIPTKTAQHAIQFLVDRNYIKLTRGKMTRLAQDLQTKMDIPSRYVRDQHRQFLNLAEESLDHVDILKRDINSVTIAADSSRVAEAKKMTLRFRRKLADFLSQGNLDSVYTFAAQLFPT